MLFITSASLNSKLLHADKLYDSIGLALTSSANFFINYVVFQVLRFCPLILCMLFLVTMPYAIRCALWPEGGSITHQALTAVTLEYVCSDVPFSSVCSRGIICKHGAEGSSRWCMSRTPRQSFAGRNTGTDGQGVDVQGFFLVPYRIFAPTLFPIFTVLRYCRILPYPM